MTLVPAGSNPGDVIGEVSVERTPVAIDASIQNYGSHDVGRWGLLVRGEAYGLLGLGDRASIGFYTTAQTHEQNVLQGGYDIRLGSEGLAVGGHYTRAWTHPFVSANTASVRSTASVGTLSVAYPLLRKQAQNIRLSGGLDLIDEAIAYGSVTLTKDRSSTLFVQLTLDDMDQGSITGLGEFSISEPRWRGNASFQLRKGLGILNARSHCGTDPCYSAIGLSHAEADTSATIIRFEGDAEYRPIPALAFVLSPRAQFSTAPLVNYELFAGGNFTVGRGYDPGTILGDKGFGFSAEVRAGKISTQAPKRLSVQPYMFVDQAYAWNNRGTDLAYQGRQSLLSAGGGIRAEYDGRIRLDLTVANPVEHDGLIYTREPTRLLMSLTTRLWPR